MMSSVSTLLVFLEEKEAAGVRALIETVKRISDSMMTMTK
jgi:hypothetical protein